MKLQLNIVTILLAAGCLFLGYKYFQESTLHKNSQEINDKLMEDFMVKAAQERKLNQRDSIVASENMDSAKRVYEALKVKDQKEKNYYKKLLNDYQKNRSVSSKQLYIDSVTRARRSLR